MPYGGIYAKVSTAARANPTNAKLQALVTTVFQGTTLRAMLFEAYGFSVFATIAYWAGIASFILAGAMLILVLVGLAHLLNTPAEKELSIGLNVGRKEQLLETA